jgi:hypothetical protein
MNSNSIPRSRSSSCARSNPTRSTRKGEVSHRDRIAPGRRTGVALGREERDARVAGAHRRLAPPFGVTAIHPEYVAVPLDRALDVGDGDRDVIDLGDVHALTVGFAPGR